MKLNPTHIDALVNHALDLADDNRAAAIVLLTDSVAWAAHRFLRADMVAAALTLAIDALTTMRDAAVAEKKGEPS